MEETVACTKLEDLLKLVTVAELKPGTSYMMVIAREALPEASLNHLAGIFQRQGFNPPIMVRKWSGEFSLYALDQENNLEEVEIRATCRACGGAIIGVFDLGEHWPSEFPERPGEHARPKVPLNLVRCHACGLIQLEHTVPAAWMFKEHYWYRSGINEAMCAALWEVVLKACSLVDLAEDDVVIDIGANDGTLLSFYPEMIEHRLVRKAYEPAENLQELLRANAEVVYPFFFPSGIHAARQAKVITSIACFYSNPDPGAFVAEVKRLLAPEGVWINQLAYLPRMLANSAFDSICHEHLTYWALAPMIRLLFLHDLEIFDAEEVAVNEGSIRLMISHLGSREVSPRVKKLVDAEEKLGLHNTNEPYLALRDHAVEILAGIWRAINEVGKCDLLGASTKANTLLQWCNLGPKQIRRAIDRSPEKVGRFTVTGIPIVSEEEGRRDPADLLLVGPWAFRDQLLERERGKWPKGTHVLFPCPKMEQVIL